MIKKRILILMSVFVLLFNSLSPVLTMAADGGGASFDTDNFDIMGDLETLADELQENIDSGKLDPSFTVGSFTAALGSAFATLTSAGNPLVWGAIAGAIGSAGGTLLGDCKSIKDQQGNFGYDIGASAVQQMYDIAVKELAENSTYSARPIILPRGYVILDLANMTYDSGSPEIGTYPVMFGSGRDNNWPIQWYFSEWLRDTTYVWVQDVIVSSAYWTNGVITLYGYSADGTQNKGDIRYPSDGATANNWLYAGQGNNYVPLITGSSFIAWTNQPDMFNISARKETLLRNPWLDDGTKISHDSLFGTNWQTINETNYNTINNGTFADVSSLLSALNEQNETMNELLLSVNEVLDSLEEIRAYAEQILNLVSKWYPDYDSEDLPPFPNVSAVADDYQIDDAEYNNNIITYLLTSNLAFLFLVPLFFVVLGYCIYGGET